MADAAGQAPGSQSRRLVLADPRGAVHRCREFTREVLHDWGWLPAVGAEQRMAAEDVLMMTSELVTNACRHAGGPNELVLRRTGPVLRVEVSDSSPRPPVLLLAGRPSQPGGHGLRVVDRLARAWGSEPAGPGKRVWLEVRSPQPCRPD
ncbi:MULTISPECIES: ATP-binding protein [Kitasatospora]|uniref:ATP-binding protein n=1 Tax=Kitasatospora cystarginea TaxID=58350 RepID=A0ABN3E7K8_9ACTN